jgi:hypothetical protein
MLMALLIDDNDQIVASAPACDFTDVGERYWRDLYPHAIETVGTETAVVDVTSTRLQRALLDLMRYNANLEEVRAIIDTTAHPIREATTLVSSRAA